MVNLFFKIVQEVSHLMKEFCSRFFGNALNEPIKSEAVFNAFSRI